MVSNQFETTLKLLNDGGKIPNSYGRGWRFDYRLRNLLLLDIKFARWSIVSYALALACRPSVSK